MEAQIKEQKRCTCHPIPGLFLKPAIPDKGERCRMNRKRTSLRKRVSWAWKEGWGWNRREKISQDKPDQSSGMEVGMRVVWVRDSEEIPKQNQASWPTNAEKAGRAGGRGHVGRAP